MSLAVYPCALTMASAAPMPSAPAVCLVNAGAVVVRVASTPPCAFALGTVLVCVVEVVEEGVVPVAVVLWMVVPDGPALEIDTVFVPEDPHPLSASSPTAR